MEGDARAGLVPSRTQFYLAFRQAFTSMCQHLWGDSVRMSTVVCDGVKGGCLETSPLVS